MTKDSNTDGDWHTHRTFRFSQLDETGASGSFATSQTKTTQPTLYLSSEQKPRKIVSGLIKRVHYRLKPTNAVTYTLRLWEEAVDGSTQPYHENLHMLYESPPLQASDTDYDDRKEVNIPFRLRVPGTLYYSIEWTGAPGVTSGFISVSGDCFE
jgi:hypothetical protein